MFEQLQEIKELKGCVSVQQFLKNIQAHLNRTHITIDIVNNLIKNNRTKETLIFGDESDIYKHKGHTFILNEKNRKIEIEYPENTNYQTDINDSVGSLFKSKKYLKSYLLLFKDLVEFKNTSSDFSANLEEWRAFYLKHPIILYSRKDVIDKIDILLHLTKHDNNFFLNNIINNYKVINAENIRSYDFCIEATLSNNIIMSESSRIAKTKDGHSKLSHYINLRMEIHNTLEVDGKKELRVDKKNIDVVDNIIVFSVNNNKLKESKLISNKIQQELEKINKCIAFSVELDKYLKFSGTQARLSVEELDLLLLTTDNKDFEKLSNFLVENKNNTKNRLF